MIFALYPSGTPEILVAAGAVNLTSYSTTVVSGASDTAYTLADSEKIGQVKKVLLNIDGGGNAVLTPATFADGTTVTFADAGDYVILMWASDTDGWTVIEKGNESDGATFPAVA